MGNIPEEVSYQGSNKGALLDGENVLEEGGERE